MRAGGVAAHAVLQVCAEAGFGTDAAQYASATVTPSVDLQIIVLVANPLQVELQVPNTPIDQSERRRGHVLAA